MATASRIAQHHVLASPVPSLAHVLLVGTSPLLPALTQALAAEQIQVSHCPLLDEADALIQQDSVLEKALPQPALVVALSAFCRPDFDRRVQQWCIEHAFPFVRLSIWQHEAVLGPFVPAGTTGCVVCAETRRIRALVSMAQQELSFLRWCKEHDDELQARPANPWLTHAARRTISLTAAQNIARFLQNGIPIIGLHSVCFLRLHTLTSTSHSFLPDPLCELCATRQEDRAEDAVLHLQPRLRTTPDHYHLRPLAQTLETLLEHYVDQRMGMHFLPANGLHTTAALFASTVSHYFEYPYICQEITGSGLANTFRMSHSIAIMEALERTCGFLPRGKRSTIYGSYTQLREHAIDPERFGLFHPEQLQAFYEQRRGSQYIRPYTPDLSFYWVWGYSFQRQQPVLIPEQLAYYGAQTMRPDAEQFMVETSNGCAIGGSLEEAILHGLCEVIERDAFFLTWYGRLKVPALDWRSTRDPQLRLAFERSIRMTGFDFYAFDCSMDLPIPVILVVAVNRRRQAPMVMLGAAAHPDPDKALATAFYEAASDIVGQQERFPHDLARGARLVADHSLIRNIEDHVLAGAMPEAFSRFAFLLEEQPLRSMPEHFAQRYMRKRYGDLTEELQAFIAEIIRRGYDVLVVDQTSPELQQENFAAVRVLVPGFVPLTIGHQYRRTYHLPRLYHLPQELGYTDHVLCEADLNPDPHAFP